MLLTWLSRRSCKHLLRGDSGKWPCLCLYEVMEFPVVFQVSKILLLHFLQLLQLELM